MISEQLTYWKGLFDDKLIAKADYEKKKDEVLAGATALLPARPAASSISSSPAVLPQKHTPPRRTPGNSPHKKKAKRQASMVPFGPKAGYYTKVIQRGNQVVAVPAIKWDGKFADVKPFGARARNLQCRNGCGKMFDHGPARAAHEKAMKCVPKAELDARLSAGRRLPHQLQQQDHRRAQHQRPSASGAAQRRVHLALGGGREAWPVAAAVLVPVPVLVVLASRPSSSQQPSQPSFLTASAPQPAPQRCVS